MLRIREASFLHKALNSSSIWDRSAYVRLKLTNSWAIGQFGCFRKANEWMTWFIKAVKRTQFNLRTLLHRKAGWIYWITHVIVLSALCCCCIADKDCLCSYVSAQLFQSNRKQAVCQWIFINCKLPGHIGTATTALRCVPTHFRHPWISWLRSPQIFLSSCVPCTLVWVLCSRALRG